VAVHEFQQTGFTNNLYIIQKAAVIRTCNMGLKRASVQCVLTKYHEKYLIIV